MEAALVGVFGGELDYQRYGLFNRYMIRLIMTINKGPTDLHTKVSLHRLGRGAALRGEHGSRQRRADGRPEPEMSERLERLGDRQHAVALLSAVAGR